MFIFLVVMSLRGLWAMLTEDPVHKGEQMFRLFASEVWAGPLCAIVLVMPALWKPILQRVLDHRLKDGPRFESKELTLFVIGGIFPLFVGFWILIRTHTATSSVQSTFYICLLCAIVASTPRVIRWSVYCVWRFQRCSPACHRAFGKCSAFQVESPYGEQMWGGASVGPAGIRLGPDGKPIQEEGELGRDTIETKAVFPLVKVIEFDIATDPVKLKAQEEMKQLGKSGSPVKFPQFASVKVFDDLERAQSSTFTLDMFGSDKRGSTLSPSVFDGTPQSKRSSALVGLIASDKSSRNSSPDKHAEDTDTPTKRRVGWA